MDGFRTPERPEFQIPPASLPPPPRKKPVVVVVKKMREVPENNGYFQLPADDLERFFLCCSHP